MKLTTIVALTATMATPAYAAPTISAVYDSTSPFLINNGLASARITISGWQPGDRIRGIIGTAENPWLVRTWDGSAFFNIDSVSSPSGSLIFEDGVFAAAAILAPMLGQGAAFDTGLLGGANNNPNFTNLGSPTDDDATDDVGGFAMFSARGDADCFIEPMQWLTTEPAGLTPPFTLNVMRVTADSGARVWVRFVLVMATGEQIPMQIDILFAVTQCPWDLNADSQVNIADLLILISNWGPGCGPGDFNIDGTVNVADILNLIQHWNGC